jgi:hypothetical protein
MTLSCDALAVLEHGHVLEACLQARIVDGDAGRRRQHHGQPLVLRAELGPALFVSEIEAADRLSAPDRDAEERHHVRMPGREPGRQRVLAHVAQPHRLRVAQQEPEDALALREPPHRVARELVDARRLQLGQLAVFADDAESAVPRVYQPASRVDDPLQHRRQAQIRADAEHRVEQLLEARVRPFHACHRRPF